MSMDREVVRALDVLNHSLVWKYNVTILDVVITNTPGYWKMKKPCDETCKSPLHSCIGNNEPIRHTVLHTDEGRGIDGKFTSPYTTWNIIKKSGIMEDTSMEEKEHSVCPDLKTDACGVCEGKYVECKNGMVVMEQKCATCEFLGKIKLRPEVQWFAERMEMKLRMNDDKEGWDNCPDWYLINGIHGETRELEEACGIACYHCGREMHPSNITDKISECLDIADYAMMIADNERKRKLKR